MAPIPTNSNSSKTGECVRVMVRIRPLNTKEKQDNRKTIAIANFERAEIAVTNPEGSEPAKIYTFDAAFPAGTSQRQIYDTAATEIVEAVMNGYNGTIFAYGQTGAGKSHTMEGYPDPPELRGIIPNSFTHIFDKVAIMANKRFLVRASYLEIYNEEIRDLLGKDPKNTLELKENTDTGIYVKDLTSYPVKSAAEIDRVMQIGKKNRSVGATQMNQTSSRSHSIFTIVVECASDSTDGEEHICMGKLNLVDLAGSERQSKTGATGDRLKEATKINLSLSALGNVISALVDGKSQHIPYRDSKLTRLLQDSLGGNTKTVMIANCGPVDYNYEETHTTLRYASRAKNIKNKPKINEDPKDAMLREFEDEIKALKAQLANTENVSLLNNNLMSNNKNEEKVEIIEVTKVVEKIIIEKGLNEEEAKLIYEKNKKEKEEMMKKTQEELSLIAQDKAKTEYNKREMEHKLQMEQNKKNEIALQELNLKLKIKEMEEKLVVGGAMVDKATKQEEALRQATLELEERKRQELKLSRDLAEREESKLMIEEQYHSLQEEAEAKTRKLKKVWTKVKEVQAEIKQMQETFNRDREDLLDTIRDLTGQLKLKTLILEHFIPRESLALLESRAKWSEELDNWSMEKLDLAGNSIRPRQRVLANVRRPESTNDKYKNKKLLNNDNPAYDDENEFEIVVEDIKSPYLAYQIDDEGEGYVLAETIKKTNKKNDKTLESSSKNKSKSSTKSIETSNTRRSKS